MMLDRSLKRPIHQLIHWHSMSPALNPIPVGDRMSLRPHRPFLALASLVFAVTGSTCFAQHAAGNGFEPVANYVGIGGQFASVVAPGRSGEGEWLYLSYLYEDSTLEVVGVNPDTGAFEVLPNPAPGEFAARCMVRGPDSVVYLGTYPHGHLLRLDPKTDCLVDLGMPADTPEQFIWSLAFASDGRLYGGTSPHAKLVCYDPASGRLEDLGRLDPKEEIVRYVAASKDGFVYAGVGTGRANIAAYEIASGERREILPPEFQTTGIARVFLGLDGEVYGNVGDHYFKLHGWDATGVAEASAARPRYQNQLRDGRVVSAEGQILTIIDPKTKQKSTRRFNYQGRGLKIFRLSRAVDGTIYASSELPANLLRLRPGSRTFEEVGPLGDGEVYSLLLQGSHLRMAAYGCGSPLLDYDPALPFGANNPKRIAYSGSDADWRPKAMISGPDGSTYVGSDLGYGKLGGVLVDWKSDQPAPLASENPVSEESIISLANWNNLVVAGTSIVGGSGTQSQQKEAVIFLWDPSHRRVLFQQSLRYGAINDVTVVRDTAFAISGRNLLVFDLRARALKTSRPLPPEFQSTIYNAAGLGPDGRIWGLNSAGVFAIDPDSLEIQQLGRTEHSVTGGFALDGDGIDLICGGEVLHFRASRRGVH